MGMHAHIWLARESYWCKCVPGYDSDTCEICIDECASLPHQMGVLELVMFMAAVVHVLLSRI